MHEHLIGYLKDNRDQIVENWLMAANPGALAGEEKNENDSLVSLDFLMEIFDVIIDLIKYERTPREVSQKAHSHNPISPTTPTKQDTLAERLCGELCQSGISAFKSVTDETWDSASEFEASTKAYHTEIIALAFKRFFKEGLDRFCSQAGPAPPREMP